MLKFVDRRPAFTLVELLVVVGIIAILAGLLGAAVMKMIPTQQRKNTELTIRKLNALLQRNWKLVTDQVNDDMRRNQVPGAVFTLAGGDTDRAKVIWTKLRLKQQFPATYAEAQLPSGINGGKNGPPNAYNGQTFIFPEASYGLVLGSKMKANDQSTEMAACLLMALTRVNRAGVNTDADLLGTLEVKDTDGDGIPEIVDGWGTPLGFYRWPRGNPDVNGLGPAVTFRDPQDPLGRLQTPAAGWGSTPFPGMPPGVPSRFGDIFQNLCHPLGPLGPLASPPVPATPEPYTMPVIVSAGPDKQMGYGDAYMTSNGAASNDNILSYDLR